MRVVLCGGHLGDKLFYRLLSFIFYWRAGAVCVFN